MELTSPNLADLIEAIVKQRAVVLVGSGASASCGVPSWKDLLQQCIDRAQKYESGSNRLRLAARAMDSGDYPLAAELLKKRLGPRELQRALREIINPHTTTGPGEIHFSIARIPFSLFLTTNYDSLLEDAYLRLKPDPLPFYTWQEEDEILRVVRDHQPALLKLHGSLERPKSLVFARREYSQLTYHKLALANTLKTLFLLRTFLFIGHSLRDADLLHLLETAKADSPSSFGPHYAILPSDETDAEHGQFLEQQYGIRVIPCQVGATAQTHWDVYNRGNSGFVVGERGFGPATALDTVDAPILKPSAFGRGWDLGACVNGGVEGRAGDAPLPPKWLITMGLRQKNRFNECKACGCEPASNHMSGFGFSATDSDSGRRAHGSHERARSARKGRKKHVSVLPRPNRSPWIVVEQNHNGIGKLMVPAFQIYANMNLINDL